MKTVIVQIDNAKDNPLRKHASPVKKEEFGTKELKALIKSMQAALAKESDGVALAAPQLGIEKRIFVVAPSAYEEDAKWKPLIFINPVITKASKKLEERQEGCLSVRWVYGTTKRHVSATIEAYDVEGNKFSYGASGLIAHIFQHEVDHLDGILFIDHGYNFEEYTEDQVREAANKQ
jgi:peptide deformylase